MVGEREIRMILSVPGTAVAGKGRKARASHVAVITAVTTPRNICGSVLSPSYFFWRPARSRFFLASRAARTYRDPRLAQKNRQNGRNRIVARVLDTQYLLFRGAGSATG